MEDKTLLDGVMPKAGIDAKEVRKILSDCFLKEDEVKDGKPLVDIIKVEGITSFVGLHPERTLSHKDRIIEILSEISNLEEGISFLNFCVDKEGRQWGEHRNCEELVILGLAVGYLKYCLPREMWMCLPGGVPYIQLNTEENPKR